MTDIVIISRQLCLGQSKLSPCAVPLGGLFYDPTQGMSFRAGLAARNLLFAGSGDAREVRIRSAALKGTISPA
jgi:hypothetical protein